MNSKCHTVLLAAGKRVHAANSMCSYFAYTEKKFGMQCVFWIISFFLSLSLSRCVELFSLYAEMEIKLTS